MPLSPREKGMIKRCQILMEPPEIDAPQHKLFNYVNFYDEYQTIYGCPCNHRFQCRFKDLVEEKLNGSEN